MTYDPRKKGEAATKIADLEKWNRELLEKIEASGLREVPIKSIRIDAEARRFSDESMVRRLIASRERRGNWLAYPILRGENGTYVPISGTHRILAALERHESSITARVLKVSDEEAWAIRLEENLCRRHVPPKELYAAFRRARDEFKWTQAQIAETVGLSQGRVSQILSWGDGGFVKRAPVLESNNPAALSEVIAMVKDGSPSDASQPDFEPTPQTTQPSVSETSSPGTLSDEPESGKGGTGVKENVSAEPQRREPEKAETPIRPPAAPDSLPSGHWTAKQVSQHRGGLNGLLLWEIANADKDEQARQHLFAVYQKLKKLFEVSV